ncbi:quinone oxidoreductase family protein [Alicyclobacillus dauci]|uniref:Zinc-binding dehydrogenase n=1 Tax=Alicyclobacillus dauci TaxID=1475485 RepID=A0ABY6Z237_9BACL|nr:zinc-binding dehydrogenase [Alicyclobacillus dauci]WAH36281.1 zinc-binding dehydrogenase [Alicyclobacillus dauci]
MKAIVSKAEQGRSGVHYTDIPTPTPGAGQVRIQLQTAGLNRRDLRVISQTKIGDAPMIIGSDGAGIVETLGEGVRDFEVGDEVIIHPTLKWITNTPAPPADYEILGSPTHGTFAEFIVIEANHVARKPKYLTWEEAGVLPLAALTAYRALFTRGQVQSDQTVLIPGVGGGVATYLVQFTKAVGARVVVTSRSAEKRQFATKLGADLAIDSTQDWQEQLGGDKVDLVIDSVGAATFDKCLASLKPGGTLVTFGATAGDEIPFDLRSFFYGQFDLRGSTMGSREEFDAMLRFIAEHEIRPVLDRSYPLSEAKVALERLQETENFGKIGLQIH